MLNIENICKDKFCLDWDTISYSYKLSEDNIREFQYKVNWASISNSQKLSEEFIREFKNKVYWDYISIYQKLSEPFIREFQDKVNWSSISTYQKLSEKFIREFQDKVDWYRIELYQKLSEDFIREFNLVIPESSWMYKDIEWKRKYIQENTEYEIIGNKVIAYKSCRSDGYSVYNFQYHYEIGNEYNCHADYNPKNRNSFGLSAWSKEYALEYCNERLFRVEIELENIVCIVHEGNKIRASKIKIIEEL